MTAAVDTTEGVLAATEKQGLADPLLAKRWKKIQGFQFDDPAAELPFSKALASEMEWDDEFTQTALDEYRKFMMLASIKPGQTVPAIDVDTVWHWHLLYTRSYQEFCQEVLDRPFLHHEPSKGGTAEDERYATLYAETLKRYRQLFGTPVVEIWGTE